MTSTLERPALKRPARPTARRGASSRSPFGPGLVAAAWALGAGIVILAFPVLVVWATDSRSGAGAASATRAVGQLWLFAHGTSMAVPGGSVGLTLLGLMAVPLLLLHRAGRHAARTMGPDGVGAAIRLTAAIAFPYACCAALVAALSTTEQIRPAPVQAVLASLAVAVVGAGSGVVREGGLMGEGRRLPVRVRRLLVGTVVVVAAMVAAGSMLAGLGLVRHADRASSLAGASDPGLVGGLALLVIGVLSVPNAGVWGAAWLAGPGFSVGAGTAVGPFGTSLGAVPALPVFAALPSTAVPTWLGVMALAVPVAAGAFGGVRLVRGRALSPGKAAVEGLLLGPCAGLAMTALVWLSGGPLGGGRLTEVGPSPWRVGLAVATEVALGAAAAASVVRRSSRSGAGRD